MRRSHPGVPCARSERGAAAVEAGLVTTFLMPLLLGIMFFGNYFWHAQKADAYPVRIRSGAIQGSGLTCQELVDRVKATVVANAANLADSTPIDLADVTADVVEVLPTVGAVVRVSVRTNVDSPLSSFLPDGGALVSDTLVRLDDVTLTTTSC